MIYPYSSTYYTPSKEVSFITIVFCLGVFAFYDCRIIALLLIDNLLRDLVEGAVADQLVDICGTVRGICPLDASMPLRLDSVGTCQIVFDEITTRG